MSTPARRNGRPGPSPQGDGASAPADHAPASLVEAIEHEARALRSIGDEVHHLMADELDRLAQLVRWTGATTAVEHRDRLLALDENRDADLAAREWHEGYRAGRRDGRNLAFDEISLVLRRRAFLSAADRAALR